MTLLTDALPLLEQKEVSALVRHDKEPPASFLPDRVSLSGDPLSAPRLGLALPVQKNCSWQFQNGTAIQMASQWEHTGARTG